jgi:NADH-quinone oxidoreductase subunit L
MENILPIFLIIPLISLLIIQLFNHKDEKAIYWTAALGNIFTMIMLVGITVMWLIDTFPTMVYHGPVLYQSKEAEFGVNLFMDVYSYIYIFVTTAITAIIIRFSRTYVHRERGYKRYFSNVLFFYFGLLTILLAGNLEILFVGWEILGVTSFFLIGFYRERYLPVKNAIKVVSLYRVADIALLLGIWICHHYFGHSIHFDSLEGMQGGSQDHILNETFYQFMIPSVFLLAAMVKSAQFPFSSWVPRAMEGPTTSSAIFYGSLSIHIGVYLLIRTAPLWEDNIVMHVIIAELA